MRSLLLLHRLPTWRHGNTSSSISNSSRLWAGDTTTTAAAAATITSPRAAYPFQSTTGVQAAARLFPCAARAAPIAAAAVSIDARSFSREEQSPQADSSSRAATAATATAAAPGAHYWCTDTAYFNRSSNMQQMASLQQRQQQVASLQQQLQLHLPSSRGFFVSSEGRSAADVSFCPSAAERAAAAAAGSSCIPATSAAAEAAAYRGDARATTPTAAATDVWIGLPSRSSGWCYFEETDLQQQQQQQQQQRQQQQGLWLPHPDSGGVGVSETSPQLHKVFSMRRIDDFSCRSSISSLTPAAAAAATAAATAAAEGGETPGMQHLSSDSCNVSAQAPLPSRRPSLLQQESTFVGLSTGEQHQRSSSSQQQHQGAVSPEAAAAARAAAAAAGAEWSRRASARLRPAKEGAAALAQRAAAAALIAAAEEVGDGTRDARQEGRVYYPSHCVRDRLEKLFWGLGL